MAIRENLRQREKFTVETLNINYKAFSDLQLPKYETYSRIYEEVYICLERKKFCTMLGKIPHELKGDILLLFADRFIDVVLNFFKKRCETIRAYEIRRSSPVGHIGHIRCKRADGYYVSITSVNLSAGSDKHLKFEFLKDCYTIIAEFKDSLIFENLDWYKTWAKKLFLLANVF